uniref:Uncharacterized protein n=1 Tax=Anguilla anguilla TaxID=7936 RepID=A0A0E9PL98_ANGAN
MICNAHFGNTSWSILEVY